MVLLDYVRNCLTEKGVILHEDYILQSLEYLQVLGSGPSDNKMLADKVFELFLDADIREVGSADIGHLLSSDTGVTTHPMVLQIDEVVNVGSSAVRQQQQQQQQSGNISSRLLKLFLSGCPGDQYIVGLELSPIPGLTPSIPPGAKLLLKTGTLIRRGSVLLMPSHCCFLGGEVERLQTFISKQRTEEEKVGQGKVQGGDVRVEGTANGQQQHNNVVSAARAAATGVPPMIPPPLSQQPQTLLPTARLVTVATTDLPIQQQQDSFIYPIAAAAQAQPTQHKIHHTHQQQQRQDQQHRDASLAPSSSFEMHPASPVTINGYMNFDDNFESRKDSGDSDILDVWIRPLSSLTSATVNGRGHGDGQSGRKPGNGGTFLSNIDEVVSGNSFDDSFYNAYPDNSDIMCIDDAVDNDDPILVYSDINQGFVKKGDAPSVHEVEGRTVGDVEDVWGDPHLWGPTADEYESTMYNKATNVISVSNISKPRQSGIENDHNYINKNDGREAGLSELWDCEPEKNASLSNLHSFGTENKNQVTEEDREGIALEERDIFGLSTHRFSSSFLLSLRKPDSGSTLAKLDKNSSALSMEEDNDFGLVPSPPVHKTTASSTRCDATKISIGRSLDEPSALALASSAQTFVLWAYPKGLTRLKVDRTRGYDICMNLHVHTRPCTSSSSHSGLNLITDPADIGRPENVVELILVRLSSDLCSRFLGVTPEELLKAKHTMDKKKYKEYKASLGYRFEAFNGAFLVKMITQTSGDDVGGVEAGKSQVSVSSASSTLTQTQSAISAADANTMSSNQFVSSGSQKSFESQYLQGRRDEDNSGAASVVEAGSVAREAVSRGGEPTLFVLDFAPNECSLRTNSIS